MPKAFPMEFRRDVVAVGPHAANDPAERARRQDRLQRTEAAFDPIAFDAQSARAYGRIYAAVIASGRKARGARVPDLMIAATHAQKAWRSTRETRMTSRPSAGWSRSSRSDEPGDPSSPGND